MSDMNGSGLAKFEVTVDRYGYGSIILNGEEISERVNSIRLDATGGEPTVLAIQLKPGASGSFNGEGVVHIVTPVDLDALLGNLNAEEIDAEASNRLGWGDEGNLTAAIIDVIREKVRAAQS